MFDHRIEVLSVAEERDDYNDRTTELILVAVCFAQRTENGGRIVHENEVVYTIRYQDGLRPGMHIRDEGSLRKITSIHQEGRRWRLHLKCTKSDADSQG